VTLPDRAIVPPPAPAGHPLRDALLVAILLAPLIAAGLGTYVSRGLETLPFEKRRAHPWPSPASTTSVREFTAAFERAFDDRFGGREYLARLHHGIEARIFRTSSAPNVLLGRNDWLYWIGEDAKSLDRHFRGVVPLRVPLETIVGEFARRQEALAARGVPYIVAVVPDKFTIYPEHLPTWVKPAAVTPLDRVRDAVRADGRVRFVDLRAALEAAKPHRRVYYLTDSHWNFAGAAAGYEAIMREVQRALPGRLPAIAPVPWPPYVPGRDMYSGDLGAFLGVRWFFREDDPAPFGKVLADASSRCAQKVAPPPHLAQADVEIYECPREGLPTAVVWRDSMAIPLVPLLSENFRRIVWIAGRGFDPAIVDAERPDIVIQETVERGLDEIPPFKPR
jgi:alginate O-acetyltransferase complex protein AlgJ